MATIELTESTFQETIDSSDIVLVDWWAAWCGPCRQFGPVFEGASEKHPDITFGKVDTDANQALSGAAGISSIPTLMAFREGILVFAQPGAMRANDLEKVIEAVRGLDMEDVKAQIAAHEAGHAEQS